MNDPMNDPMNDSAFPAPAEQTLAAVLVNVFQPLPCDFCPSAGPTYRDPETGCFYCLPCLEMATDETLAPEDGPEDDEVIARGGAALDELLPAPDRHNSGPTRVGGRASTRSPPALGRNTDRADS